MFTITGDEVVDGRFLSHSDFSLYVVVYVKDAAQIPRSAPGNAHIVRLRPFGFDL